jgi:hypothetical protein
MDKLKVVVLGTGNVSSYSVMALSDRPDTEITGVWAHAETAGDMIGRDAGELRGGTGPLGVIISGDMDELIALKPDCAVLGLNGSDLDAIATPIAEKFLKAGINMVGTTLAGLVYPPAYFNKKSLERLQKAATEGSASLYISGVHPGFACDQLPAMILTAANKVTQVSAFELFNYSMAPNEFEMKEGRGFGMPMDYEAMADDHDFMVSTWGPCVAYIAAALGYEIERFTTKYEKALTDRDIPVGYGIIKAGTVGAVRLQVIGVIGGKEVITVGAVNRMANDVAPEWPIGASEAMYRISVEGSPGLECDFAFDHNDGAYGYSVVALRAINAIPYVVSAKPGILSSLDLPMTEPRGVFRD